MTPHRAGRERKRAAEASVPRRPTPALTGMPEPGDSRSTFLACLPRNGPLHGRRCPTAGAVTFAASALPPRPRTLVLAPRAARQLQRMVGPCALRTVDH